MNAMWVSLAVALCAFTVASAELSCQSQQYACCSTGRSWCTEEVYTVTDGDDSCRCDTQCPEEECCEDKESWCMQKKRVLEMHEVELENQYYAEIKAAYDEEMKKKENEKKELEQEELVGLLKALLSKRSSVN